MPTNGRSIGGLNPGDQLGNQLGDHWTRSGITTRREAMDLDTNKIDDAAIALLSLTLNDDNRVWKGID